MIITESRNAGVIRPGVVVLSKENRVALAQGRIETDSQHINDLFNEKIPRRINSALVAKGPTDPRSVSYTPGSQQGTQSSDNTGAITSNQDDKTQEQDRADEITQTASTALDGANGSGKGEGIDQGESLRSQQKSSSAKQIKESQIESADLDDDGCDPIHDATKDIMKMCLAMVVMVILAALIEIYGPIVLIIIVAMIVVAALIKLGHYSYHSSNSKQSSEVPAKQQVGTNPRYIPEFLATDDEERFKILTGRTLSEDRKEITTMNS